MTKQIISKTLAELKHAGYSQVSVSELCAKTGLSSRAVAASLKRSGLPNFRRGNETFFRLEKAHTVYFTILKAKSAIYSDLT